MPKLCEFENCRKRGNYGPKGERCSEHRESRKNANLYCPCGKRASFNYPDQTKGVCCMGCKLDGMENVTSMKCPCGKQATFNYPDQTKGVCCVGCKCDGMEDVRHRNEMCPCGKRASFNYPGQTKGVCCASCKCNGMEDVLHRNAMCPCGTRASFNYPHLTKGVCCVGCKLDGMENVTNSNAMCPCGKRASFNYPDLTKGAYCLGCKLDGMENVTTKRCKGQAGLCTTVANRKYRGYCTFCYQHEFPNDVLTLQIRCKSKEIAVRDFIDINYNGFIHDKMLSTGHCDCTVRRRPDHRILIGNTMLCIETDENQHKSYSEMDEETRENDLFMAFSGKWIYIRFNPDKYINAKGKSVNPSISTRLRVLGTMIDNQLARAEAESNTELVERYYMFYDGTK